MNPMKTDPAYIAGYLSAALETAEHQRNGLAVETLRDAIHGILEGIYEVDPFIGELHGVKVTSVEEKTNEQ